jgi:hypothetical protein
MSRKFRVAIDSPIYGKKLLPFGMTPSGDKKYYCYIIGVLFDHMPHEIYVGKGKATRYRDHFGPLIRGVHSNPLFQRIFNQYVLWGGEWYTRFYAGKEENDEKENELLIEKEAFDTEMELIKALGRRDNGTGILTNLTDGGPGTLNRKMSEAELQLLSFGSAKRWNDPLYRQFVQEAMARARQERMEDPLYHLRVIEAAHLALETKNRNWWAMSEEEREKILRREAEERIEVNKRRSATLLAYHARKRAEKL